MDALAAVDMHGIQTSGNCIRNITSDAYAGVAPDEIVDPRPYCEILRQWSTLHPEFAFLPRKFKIAVSGATGRPCGDRLARHRSAVAEKRARRRRLCGLVGGGMGRTPIIGTLANGFVPWQQLLVFIEAIVRVYNRYGRRDNVYKARIKILVKAEGARFFEAVNAEFANILERDVDGAAHLITQAELDRVSASFTTPAGVRAQSEPGPDAKYSGDDSRAFTRWLERNVHAHRVSGYRAVDAVAQARRAGAGRHHRRADGRRGRPGRSLQPRRTARHASSRTWCCRGCRPASCSRSGKRPAAAALPRPTSAC